MRPYARELIKALSLHFEIVVYSAGIPSYVKAICELLDPENEIISHVMDRTLVQDYQNGPQKFSFKDLLQLFGNRSASNVLMVDNLPSQIV